VSPQNFNVDLFKRLSSFPTPHITFTGRRAYRVCHAILKPDGGLTLRCAPADLYGMYGNNAQESYEGWLNDGNGADPFHDDVLADSYVMLITSDSLTYMARCVICRNPGRLPDGVLTLDIST